MNQHKLTDKNRYNKMPGVAENTLRNIGIVFP